MSRPLHSHIKKSRPVAGIIVIVGGLAALVVGLMLSISFGAADIGMSTVWEAVFSFNPDLSQHQIIKELRMPRSLGSALVGAAFAVAGAVMQGMTRNPLADSGLLGLNAGAGLALALCFAFFPGMPYLSIMFFCFIGAAFGAGLVFGTGTLAKGGLTPLRLTLAGAAVSALLVALTEGIAIYFQISQDLAFWTAGGVAGVRWLHVNIMLPFVLGGVLVSLILSKSITVLSLGEDIAKGLGQNNRLVKIVASIVVLVLAGAAVSAVGSIAFVGLVIPHVARMIVGVDYRWIIPSSAILGAILMVFADVAARTINPPHETPIGALIALIGVPFFLYLARTKGRELS
ncbi:FecCD family ABC transporter permease [Aureibacillus halotolerans]|uniref:Iron complex transport system permease protein n=1 Tax=Aureibacillus halotolerans TaxID=1508390 RepID=A0A4R6TXF8_9BACI|nr:iron ABC transporter permease [Aureibacillus halotolerans]TDQ36555.1 iron complex transport system permease protein [Aureibacillus halotolerans]